MFENEILQNINGLVISAVIWVHRLAGLAYPIWHRAVVSLPPTAHLSAFNAIVGTPMAATQRRSTYHIYAATCTRDGLICVAVSSAQLAVQRGPSEKATVTASRCNSTMCARNLPLNHEKCFGIPTLRVRVASRSPRDPCSMCVCACRECWWFQCTRTSRTS